VHFIEMPLGDQLMLVGITKAREIGQQARSTGK
jgi:hypothetical protein